MWAINLSGQSLSDESFLSFVLEELDNHGIDPWWICFEITETAAIAALSRARHFIDTLTTEGCSFALDDCGTGLSSYAYLRTLPVDYLKIDGTFVDEIIKDPIAAEMVDSINQIGYLMGIKTVTEFVESNEIREKLLIDGYRLCARICHRQAATARRSPKETPCQRQPRGSAGSGKAHCLNSIWDRSAYYRKSAPLNRPRLDLEPTASVLRCCVHA